jgi:hypothetical protein
MYHHNLYSAVTYYMWTTITAVRQQLHLYTEKTLFREVQSTNILLSSLPIEVSQFRLNLVLICVLYVGLLILKKKVVELNSKPSVTVCFTVL